MQTSDNYFSFFKEKNTYLKLGSNKFLNATHSNIIGVNVTISKEHRLK